MKTHETGAPREQGCRLLTFGLVSILTLSLADRLCAAGPLPLGHPDFYPSPERPVGYRGDGNGYFPGARLPDGFWEGTPIQFELSYMDMNEGRERGQKADKAWDFADNKAHNIAWKTRLPAGGNTQPLVAGDLVFTTAEPDRLVCVDARTGAIRWMVRARPPRQRTD